MSDTPVPPTAPAGEDKTIAIISYLTIIGFIIAIVMHGSKKTQLGKFHLRQNLGLIVVGVALMIANIILAFIPIIGWLISLALSIGLLVLWVMGLISAINGQTKPLPVVGEKFQGWFGSAFE
jgi:uncharacterized membrane protein